MLAIESITSQSNKSLILAIRAGFLMSGSAFLIGFIFVPRYTMYKIPVQGWTSVIVSIYFIGGLLLANMGVIGLCLAKVFNEVKQRPLYVIQETLNIDQPEVAPVGAVRMYSDSLADRERG
jgi:dolichol-phosphate mannosyltransferase